jgi:L-asparaginase II
MTNGTPAPVLVEAWRGDMAESRHRGAYAVVDTAGRVVDSRGDTERLIYARSAIKPLQALPLIETGAADALGVTDEELALACASHGGEPRHVELVTAWLQRLGLGVDDLECGAHPPSHAPSARALYAAGREPTALYNNCSGKHTGMLATCHHRGEPTRGYIALEHPQQQRVVATLSEMCAVDLTASPRGIDGCGLPQLGIPLTALAVAFARFANPADLGPQRQAACRRIAAAMMAHPFLVAGSGRFCTRAIELAHGKALVKTGAEGVFVAAIPARGLGIALKIDDGAARAAEVAMAELLLRHAGFDAAEAASFEVLRKPAIANVAGRPVGTIVAVPGF